MSAMYEMVVSCITKQSNERTAEEINNISPWLRQKANILDSLKNEVLHEIIKNCSFAEKKRDDIIIRQGDKGDCFYVMLSGKVSIFINTEAVPDNPEDASVVVAENKYKEDGKSKKELDRTLYGKFIAVLDSGKAFGELALINEDCIRNASIIADEITHLLVINRDLYNRSMKEIQTQEFNERLNFVNNSPLFSNWLSKYKRQVAFSLRKEKYGFDMPLVTQGEPTNGLLFMLSGHAKVVINANQHQTQYAWLSVSNSNEELRLSEMNDLERSVDFEMKKPVQNSLIKRLPYIEAEHRQAQRNIEVCIVKAGEIIGDIEQGLDLSTYSSSVITIEQTEVYILDAKNFERLCNAKRNFKTLNLLKKSAIYKIKHRGKRSEARPIPFYTKLNDLILEEEERECKESELKNQKIESLKNHEKAEMNFLQHRGPLIDLYGPGSVFYRNRQLRKEKQLTEKKRQITEMALKGRRGNQHGGQTIAAMFGADRLDGSDDEYDMINDEKTLPYLYDNVDNSNQHKVVNTQLDIYDWETGSVHLHNLEDRLQNWFLSVNSLTSDKRSTAKQMEHYTILKRFKQENIDKKIIPGKKIFLRPKKQNKMRMKLMEDNRNEVFITAPKLKTVPTEMKRSSEDIVDSTSEIQITKNENSTILFQRESFSSENNHPPQYKTKSEVQRNFLSHQYTIEEYKQLKQLLKKKEIEMRVFQTAMSI